MRTLLLSLALVVASGPGSPAWSVELFWNDDDGIHRLDQDPPGGPSGHAVLYQTFETRGLTVDPAGQRLWWSDVLPLGAPIPGGVIRTGGTQGGPFETVAYKLPVPAGVAVDARHNKMYWTDLGDSNNASAVFSANLDGSDVQRLISGAWLSEIAGISIDPLRDKLYFTYINPLIDAVYTGGIARADLDGGNIEPVVGGLGKPIGVAVDPYGDGIYWADAGLSSEDHDGLIKAANLDGQGQRTILGGLDDPYGVALDLKQRDVYWSDTGTGKIQVTIMSGALPYFADVLTDLKDPTALAIPQPVFLPGDATGDNHVDRADIAVVARNYGRSGPAIKWFMGDFNGDYLVSQIDLAILQANYGAGGPSTATPLTAVPEPATGIMLLLCVLTVIGVVSYCRKRPLCRSAARVSTSIHSSWNGTETVPYRLSTDSAQAAEAI
jgi:hypothetical protein